MGLAKGIKKLAEKTVPGGDWTPLGATHRGVNKALGIEEGFMQPNFLSQRIEANRSGDSQWQKINPKNLRDYNQKMGYNYKEGGRDPIADKVSKPPSAMTAPPTGMAPPPGGPVNPMSGVQQQFAQASQLRRPGRR